MKTSMQERPASAVAPVAQYARLDQKQYAALEALCPAIDPRNGDPVVAGFANGVQFVLRKLREGFVVGR